MFKVPEVAKKIVVEEKVRVSEERKVSPAKGTYLSDSPLISNPFSLTFYREERGHPVLRATR